MRSPLEPFVPDVWTVTRAQRFWGLETGTRMTVIRLADGGLFVHCPVALDRELRAAVDALGPVRAVVASSLYHHLYVGEWMRAYPEAIVCPCPGLNEKRPDLKWGPVLGDVPRPEWTGDIDQAGLTARFEREVVFFHRKTRTFVCADALLHLSTHPSVVTRAVARFVMLNTAPGKGWMERFAVKDRVLCRRQIDRVLEWDVDGALLAHGAPLAHGGRTAIREAYAWV